MFIQEKDRRHARQEAANWQQRHHFRQYRENLIEMHIRCGMLAGRGQNRRQRRQHLVRNAHKAAISGEIVRFDTQQPELFAVHDALLTAFTGVSC